MHVKKHTPGRLFPNIDWKNDEGPVGWVGIEHFGLTEKDDDLALIGYAWNHADAILWCAAPDMLTALEDSASRFADVLDNLLFPDRGGKSLLTPDQIVWRKKIEGWLKETRASIALACPQKST